VKYGFAVISFLIFFSAHAQRLFYPPPEPKTIVKPSLNGSALSINIFGIPFNDFSVYYEVTRNEKKRYGISGGYMIAFNWWRGKQDGGTGGIEVDDDRIPLGVYNGPELRLYYMALKQKPDRVTFNGPQLLFKYLFYNNTTFIDFQKSGEAIPVWFTRNETAYVIDAEWLLGNEYYEGNLIYGYYFGFGLRYRIRYVSTIHNYSEEGTLFANSFRPVGNKTIAQFIPVINFGFKFGVRLKKK